MTILAQASVSWNLLNALAHEQMLLAVTPRGCPYRGFLLTESS